MTHTSDGAAPSVYDLVGGAETFQKLAQAFYARVDHDPQLRPLYPPRLECATDALSRFLTQFFGGPCEYSRRRARPSLREAHARFRIGSAERDAWLRCMAEALEDVGIEEPYRGAMRYYFEASATFLINHPPTALEPARLDWESPTGVHAEVMERWEGQRAYEELITAALAGDAEAALRLADSAPIRLLTQRDPAALLTMLAAMGGSGSTELLAYVQRRLDAEPGLAAARYGDGRSLLHDAAGQWAPDFAQLLLSMGADPNAIDEFGHAPLYAAGNRFMKRGSLNEEAGGELARVLVRGGADVHGCGGTKLCTALHMAARQGHVEVAAALLDAGADIEARDSHGDTPLRRAVNCGKPAMAAFLLSHGADPHSRGSRGLTPLQVARGAAMQALLHRYSHQ